MKIAASLMCANPLALGEDLKELEKTSVDFWHVDIMDGVFVPNLALNLDMVKAIKNVSTVPVDAHFMVSSPEDFIEPAAQAGVDYFSFHIEATAFPFRVIDRIKNSGMKAGVAFNPGTDLAQLPLLLDRIDYLLFMSVEPGFAGQKFISAVLPKISQAAKTIKDNSLNCLIQVDGNMNVTNGKKALAAGADILVAGTSSVFLAEGKLGDNLQSFRQALKS